MRKPLGTQKRDGPTDQKKKKKNKEEKGKKEKKKNNYLNETNY